MAIVAIFAGRPVLSLCSGEHTGPTTHEIAWPNIDVSALRVYLVLSLVICMPMLWLWFEKPHPLSDFTPAYAFPIFPMVRRQQLAPITVSLTLRRL